jgi:hypothetical protein
LTAITDISNPIPTLSPDACVSPINSVGVYLFDHGRVS